MDLKLTRHLILFLLLSSMAHAEIIASDNADNDPYPVTRFLPGDNGGSGFKPWVELETGTPGAMTILSSIDNDAHSWEINGTYALGRELAQPLAVGSWSFLAQHNTQSFSGFNLKTSNSDASFASDEIFRIGTDPSQSSYNGTGLYLSTDAGASYQFLDCGWNNGEGDTIEYTLGWNTLGGSYSLTASNHTESVSATFSGNLTTGSSVAQLGVGIFCATTNESITFDAYTVIPEPLTLSILLGSGLMIAFVRRFFSI